MGISKKETVYINDKYRVNIKKCIQTSIEDNFRQRLVKRGKPGERATRPNDWRFGNNSIAPSNRVFKAVENADENVWGAGWLGN